METLVLDVRAGATGGALLGALVEAGASLEAVHEAVRTLGSGPVRMSARGGRDGTYVRVLAPVGVTTASTWGELRPRVAHAAAPTEVVTAALEVLDALLVARAAVHGVGVEEVELDHLAGPGELAEAFSLAAALHSLGVREVLVSPLGHGTGLLATLEGPVQLPGPVVSELLAGLSTTPLPLSCQVLDPLAAAWLRGHALRGAAVVDDDLAVPGQWGPSGRGRVACGRTLRATRVPTLVLA